MDLFERATGKYYRQCEMSGMKPLKPDRRISRMQEVGKDFVVYLRNEDGLIRAICLEGEGV